MKVTNSEKTKNSVPIKSSIINFPEVWMNDLKIASNGSIKNIIPNYVLILENDKELKGKLRLNQHSNRVEIKDTVRFSWNDKS